VLNDPTAPFLPKLTDARRVAVDIAIAIGEAAEAAGLARRMTAAERRQRVIETQWTPQYADLEE
jgi:malic enzyme